MDDDKARILTFLANHGGSSAENIHGALNIPIPEVKGLLAVLMEENKVFFTVEVTKKATVRRWSLKE